MPKANVLADFYDRMRDNDVDYDVIGLSYYPAYHGSITTLETAIKLLENKAYGKDIMVVETGYSYAWALAETTFDYTAAYPYSEEGQRRFTADLVAMLQSHESVTGLFWWWPEDNGTKNVTDSWWNAALYNHNTGKPYAAFYELKAFAPAVNAISTAKVSYVSRDSYWYNLQGMRLDSKPQRRGLYITDGKKVFVK